ncbi:MAG: DUF47 family protein [Coriobacteriia bacterium]|nr:DUF47 family protein [Coriobacteriia bacterium]
MAKKTRGFDYFDQFVKQAEHCVMISEILAQHSHNWDEKDNLPEVLKQAHEIEHAADELNHQIYQAAAKEFVTPIEREDILEIAHSLDNVVDSIEEVLRDYYMYDACVMAEGTVEFTELINKACVALKEAMVEFQNFRRSKDLRDKVMAVNALEEEGDRLYLDVVRGLHTRYERNEEAMRIMVWSRIFRGMENCLDAIEHVADSLATVVVRNS